MLTEQGKATLDTSQIKVSYVIYSTSVYMFASVQLIVALQIEGRNPEVFFFSR